MFALVLGMTVLGCGVDTSGDGAELAGGDPPVEYARQAWAEEVSVRICAGSRHCNGRDDLRKIDACPVAVHAALAPAGHENEIIVKGDVIACYDAGQEISTADVCAGTFDLPDACQPLEVQ